MITFKYKEGYIHENFTVGRVEVQFNYILVEVKSVHAAKILITKLMRGEK